MLPEVPTFRGVPTYFRFVGINVKAYYLSQTADVVDAKVYLLTV